MGFILIGGKNSSETFEYLNSFGVFFWWAWKRMYEARQVRLCQGFWIKPYSIYQRHYLVNISKSVYKFYGVNYVAQTTFVTIKIALTKNHDDIFGGVNFFDMPFFHQKMSKDMSFHLLEWKLSENYLKTQLRQVLVGQTQTIKKGRTFCFPKSPNNKTMTLKSSSKQKYLIFLSPR